MRPSSQFLDAKALFREGWSPSDVSRALSIPRRTVGEWQVAMQAGLTSRTTRRASTARQPPACPICVGRDLDSHSYAYLLGLYLGDGCLSPQKATSWKLRIVQDSRYPDLILECVQAMEAVLDLCRVHIHDRGTWVEIHSSWPHWICLFPQHGSGKKHDRSIVLAPWQQEIANSEAQALVRGLIHSDGHRAINEIHHRSVTGPKRYRYVRYQFKNVSKDIQQIFTTALDRLDVGWTQASNTTISIARRADVDRLDQFVGPKR